MTAYTEMAATLNRLATLTSVRRTRGADERRREVNGGEADELRDRVADAVAQLKKATALLEDGLA
jgi:hypothetical protein